MAKKKDDAATEEKKKITGDAALDAVINKLNKSFGRNMITERPVVKNIPAIPTGSLSLDLALGYGGFPLNKIIEIFGKEQSGKTSLSLSVMARILALPENKDKRGLIVDMEYTMNEAFIEGFGIPLDRIIFGQFDNAEQALQSTMDLTKTGKICCLVFDSIDACQRQATLEKDLGEADFGGISKIASRFFREYSKVCAKTQCTGIFINQERDTMSMYGSAKTTPGGNALKFYASLRLKAKPIKPSKTTLSAYIKTLTIVKNKGAPRPNDDVEFEFIYGQGPDPFLDTVNAGKSMGVLFFQGKTTKLKDGDEIEVLCKEGGIAGFLELAKLDPTLIEKVRVACEKARGPVEMIEEAPEEEPEEFDDEETAENTD